jgi:hypothetical protein
MVAVFREYVQRRVQLMQMKHRKGQPLKCFATAPSVGKRRRIHERSDLPHGQPPSGPLDGVSTDTVTSSGANV